MYSIDGTEHAYSIISLSVLPAPVQGAGNTTFTTLVVNVASVRRLCGWDLSAPTEKCVCAGPETM